MSEPNPSSANDEVENGTAVAAAPAAEDDVSPQKVEEEIDELEEVRPPIEEEKNEEEETSDKDDDGDGFIDFPNDVDCVSPFGTTELAATAVPAMGPWGRGLLVVMMLGIAGGPLGLLERRRRRAPPEGRKQPPA